MPTGVKVSAHGSPCLWLFRRLFTPVSTHERPCFISGRTTPCLAQAILGPDRFLRAAACPIDCRLVFGRTSIAPRLASNVSQNRSGVRAAKREN